MDYFPTLTNTATRRTSTRRGNKTQFFLHKCQLLFLLQFFRGFAAIHLEAVLVPQSKFRGQNATLLCKYELEQNEELFSLKWYKEETEFYRFTPPDPLSVNHHQVNLPQPRKNHNRENKNNNNNNNYNYADANNNGDDDDEDSITTSKDTWSRHNDHGRRSWHQQQPQLEDDDIGQQPGYKVPGHVQSQPQPAPGLVQTWDVPGIKINEEASTPQRVVLKKVTFKSTGMYRCEVTAVVRQKGVAGYHGIQEFVMKESINRMTVVELPAPGSNPIITGGDIGSGAGITGSDKTGKQFYKPGDLLNLTCTSAPSNPPATLEWRINGLKVGPESVVNQHLIQRKRGLFSSTIGLLLVLKEKHFDQGQLRVLCRGTIEAEFWKKDVENVFNDKDSFVKVLEIKESQWPDSSNRMYISTFLIVTMLLLSLTLSQISASPLSFNNF